MKTLLSKEVLRLAQTLLSWMLNGSLRLDAVRVLDIRPREVTVGVELERSDDQSIVEVELIRDRSTLSIFAKGMIFSFSPKNSDCLIKIRG